MQTPTLDFIGSFELVKLLLIPVYLCKQVGICLLLCHVLGDHLAHIRIASAALDLGEGLLYLLETLHLGLHALGQELRPQLLHHELLTHLFLRLIIRLVGSQLCDLLLALHSCHSLLKGVLFVLDRSLQRHNPLLTLFLLVVNVLHQVVKLVLAL